MEKMTWDGPKWGQEGLLPANPELADILGDMDLHFENFHVFAFGDSNIMDFQVPRFPKSGPGRARLEPSGDMLIFYYVFFLCLRLFHLGETRASAAKYWFSLFRMNDECLPTFQGP